MSVGLAGLSDADLMQQLQAARAPARGITTTVAPSLSDLSDSEVLAQISATRRSPSVPNPFREDGAPASASFSDRYGDGPMASATDISQGLGQGLRREADEMLVGEPSATNTAAAGLLRGVNAAALNIPRNIGAAIKSLPGIGNDQTFSQNYEALKEREDAYARQAPRTALTGTVGGIVGGAVALPGAVTAARMAGRIGQGAALGAGYGFAGEYLDTKDLGKAGTAGLVGGAIGGVAVPFADAAIKGVQALAKSPMFARGAQVANANGELTATAKAVLTKEGIDPAQMTPELRAQMVSLFADKGETGPAAREAIAGEFGIPLSRAQATGDARAVMLEQAALSGDRGGRAQAVGQDFAARQAEAIEAAGGQFAERAGRGVSFDNPTQAVEAVADRARDYSTRAAREARAAEERAETILSGLRGPSPIDPVDAGAAVRQGLRDEAAAGKGRYQSAYRDLAELPGEFRPQALDGIGARVADSLGSDVPIDPVLTPAANRALADLDNLRLILGLEDGVGPTAQQVEQVRKRFGALYPATAQNPTDRMALGRIRSAFDNEMRGAAETGQFGPRSAPASAAPAAADNFPGFALAGRPEPAAAASRATPETMAQFIARNGGMDLSGEARAYDFHRWKVGGLKPLAREGGAPMDVLRTRLADAGFIAPDDGSGAIARDVTDEVLEALQAERQGRPTFRFEDEARAANGRKATDAVSDQNASYAAEIDRQSRRISIDMEGYGLRPHDLDRAALNDAAEAMVRGEADDAATAYDRAVARRAQIGGDVPTARPAVDEAPFPELGDGFGPVPTGSALPAATPEGERYAETARLARSLFSDYKTKFAPQGAGDDVGLAMRKIVDQNAEPVEVSRMLYGGSPGLNIRIADRVKTTLGEGSEAWAAHRQGYISSVINGRDMSPRAVSDRIGAALTGERRGLTYRVLDDQQVKGLRDYQQAAQAAGRSREAMPEWVNNLHRTDFDPNAIMSNLLGAGVPGARPGAPAYARAIRNFVGEDSAEWSGLRFATMQKLMLKPDSSEMLSPKQLAARIAEFTEGKGSGFAKQMFEPDMLAALRRYGRAVQATVYPDGSVRPNNGGAAGKLAGKALDAIAVGLGFSLGSVAGAGAAYTGRFGTKLVQGGYQARVARRSFEGVAPRVPETGPVLDLKPVVVGAGLTAEYGL